jgi:DNA repair ATPase RecN
MTTDHVVLVARLREIRETSLEALRAFPSAEYPSIANRLREIVNVLADAEDAIEQLARTVAEQAKEIAAFETRPGHTCHVSSDTCGACEFLLARNERVRAAEAKLAAASARLRTVEAETWDQARRLLEGPPQLGAIRDEFLRRAHAAREGTAPAVKPYSSGGCLDHE